MKCQQLYWADNGASRERTWKLRNHILLSTMENVRMWSMNGLARRAVEGTPKICDPGQYMNVATLAD